MPTPEITRTRRVHWRQAAALTAAAAMMLALSGCSSDPEDAAVTAAEVNVSAKEKALADAQAAVAETEAAFCGASADYITALDRYGDILNETAPTVGDVKTAGADLVEPQEATVSAGEAAVSAREDLVEAEQALADAQAALAAAEAKAAGESPAPEVSEEPTEEPAETPATVTRVQQAEQEFAATQKGITDETPLVEAAEEFNAAVVALQVSWMALFAQSGCLDDEQQEQAAAAARDYTLALQQDLADAGYFEGEVDGVYGPETVEAVKALQEANGLPQTGTVDKATDAALRAELEAAGTAADQESTTTTAALQQTLKLAGYWDGPVDGQWSDELTEALKEFQTDLGVEPTGEVDAATVAAFEEALATSQATPTPSASRERGTPSPEASAAVPAPSVSAS